MKLAALGLLVCSFGCAAPRAASPAPFETYAAPRPPLHEGWAVRARDARGAEVVLTSRECTTLTRAGSRSREVPEAAADALLEAAAARVSSVARRDVEIDFSGARGPAAEDPGSVWLAVSFEAPLRAQLLAACAP